MAYSHPKRVAKRKACISINPKKILKMSNVACLSADRAIGS